MGLKPGARLDVLIDEQLREATIRSVRPELDERTRTQNVVLLLKNPGELTPGRIARIGVKEPVRMQGYWAPNSSLAPRLRGLWAVYVVGPEGKAAAREVEVIEVDGDRSFIRGALTPGERIIVGGAHRIVTGQRVASSN